MALTVNSHRIFIVLMLLILGSALNAACASAEDYVEPITGMAFVLVRGGTFDMGDITGKDKPATPAHKVSVADLFFGKHEVTFQQFDIFCEATGREKPKDNGWGRDNRPVIFVSWHDAEAFAAWLSDKTGLTFRLPSETEWEFAARGGKATPYWWGHDPAPNAANCKDCGSRWDDKSTAPVGSFTANPYGLYDMTGNVYEWCLDSQHDNYLAAPGNGTPWTGGDTSRRITRGGSWYQAATETRSFARCWDNKDNRLDEVGFRLVLEP